MGCGFLSEDRDAGGRVVADCRRNGTKRAQPMEQHHHVRDPDDPPGAWEVLRDVVVEWWDTVRSGGPEHCYRAGLAFLLGFSTVWYLVLPILRARGVF